MKRLLHRALMGLALLACASVAQAASSGKGADTGGGINNAAVIDYPTALDQTTTNVVSGGLAIFDIGKPDLRPLDLRYGFQTGAVQLLAEGYWTPDPREFDHAEAKAKLRVLSLDEYGTYFAIGFLGRYVDQKSKEKPVIDDKPYSLFGVVSQELSVFSNRDPLLVNFYLDNRYGSLGVKLPIYQFIRGVVEGDYHHASDIKERWTGKAGIELEGEQSFFVQLYYYDRQTPPVKAGEKKPNVGHIRMQIGTGF